MKEEDKGKSWTVSGDMIGMNVSGTGNIFGKNINISGTVDVNASSLAHLPAEFADGLRESADIVNKAVKARSLPPAAAAQVQTSLDELTEEVRDVKDPKEVGYTKKSKIKMRLAAVAESLIKVLPDAAEQVAAFTPLAPFGKLIGESVGGMIEAIQKDY